MCVYICVYLYLKICFKFWFTRRGANVMAHKKFYRPYPNVPITNNISVSCISYPEYIPLELRICLGDWNKMLPKSPTVNFKVVLK